MKKKVIYQTGHYGFFINGIVHKMKYHPDCDAIFLVDKIIMNPITLKFLEKNLKNFADIGKVIIINDREIIEKGSVSLEEMEKSTIKYFDKLFKNEKIDLGEVDSIYSSFDTFNAFGAYLTMKNIKFCLMESFEGQCQSNKRYFLNKSFSPYYDIMLDKYKAESYDCPCLDKLICYGKKFVDVKNYEEDVTTVGILKELNKEDVKKIIDCYNLKADLKQEISLFSLSSSWIVNEMKLELIQYMYLNQQIADYYLDENDKLLLKPHPNTDYDLQYWLKFFPNAEYIPGYFPSMLLPYIDELKIKKSLNTGTMGVDKNDEKGINVPRDVFYSFRELNKISVAHEIFKFIREKNSIINHYGLHNNAVNSILRQVVGFENECVSRWSNLMLGDNTLTVMGNINWNPGTYKEKLIKNMDSVNNNAVVIFLNNKNDFAFMTNDQRFLPYIIPIHIRKKKLKEDTMENMKEEILYVYCKDEKILNKIKQFKYSKKLKYVGVELNAEYDEKNQYLDLVNLKLDYLISKQ